MWKALHQLAIPERLYRLCGCWILAGGVERAVAGHRPWVGLLAFAPRGLSAGESYRIMYLHVPAAMWSMGLYLAMAVAAFVGVVWQIKMADLAIAALAPVGAVCTSWRWSAARHGGKPMWGPGGSGMPV